MMRKGLPWLILTIAVFALPISAATNYLRVKGLILGTVSAGDTYIVKETSTGFVRVYVDGVLKATVTGNGVIPGPCPSDLSAIELNTECSSSGRRVWRDIDGTWVSTTSGKRPAQ
jgi:hypothetical protein